jgi:hypothetical protein
MVRLCTTPYPTNSNYEEHFELFSYPLSDFQKYAIEGIVDGHHVLVTAPTGSGKTLPAEFAIDFFVKRGKKVIYTSPIKALSNQKYSDLSQKFPHISFGLMTGDIKTNPDADVIIMTTEILMNALFLENKDTTTQNQLQTQPQTQTHQLQFKMDIQHELGCVVFDEVHYINDQDRGQTWENTILMLPRHIQMVMLSATIDAPERFAKWAERDDTEKQVYLASTAKRIVPLSHYGYLTIPEGAFKSIKDKVLEKEIRDATQTLIPLQNEKGQFFENGHKVIAKMTNIFQTRNIETKRKHALNNLALFLRDRDMLPAIAFVFSRKLVEACAKEITVPVLEDDSKVGYTVRRECEQIVRKLSNSHEYLELPEYNQLVSLLEKGIGIHHSGMIPILREIVEIMISKKYIKILFATESFAIGLDCPIRTAIFTGVQKFDGQHERLLLSHEYTQMAGRAGRRGIDTVGHVVHCNNLFELPCLTEYRAMLSGKPQTLVSKFRISYGLILNLIKHGKHSRSNFEEFVQKSMTYEELQGAIVQQTQCISDKKTKYEEISKSLEHSKTPVEVCRRYLNAQDALKTSVNKKRKELERELEKLRNDHRAILTDVKSVQRLDEAYHEWRTEQDELEYLTTYIDAGIDKICNVLIHKGYIVEREEDHVVEPLETCSHIRTPSSYQLTELGTYASGIAEVHCLIVAYWIQQWNWFSEFSVIQTIGLLACFTDVKVLQEEKRSRPNSEDAWLKSRIEQLSASFQEYEDLEVQHQLRTGIEYENALNFDMTDLTMEWCALEDEVSCKGFIQTQVAEKGISVGDFTKAILKISTITRELSAIAETSGQTEFVFKLSQVDGLILKYITTAQSLYV